MTLFCYVLFLVHSSHFILFSNTVNRQIFSTENNKKGERKIKRVSVIFIDRKISTNFTDPNPVVFLSLN